MKRFVFISLASVVSLSLIAAILSICSVQRLHSAASKLANENTRLDDKAIAARARLAALNHQAEELQAALDQAKIQKEKLSSAVGAKVQPASQAQTTPPRRDLADLMEANPSLRVLFKQSFRANIGLRFRPLYDAARYSPEQIEKFEELLADVEQDRLDLQAIAKAQGLSGNDPSLVKMRDQTEAKLQNAQKEILGGAGYEELQRYNRQIPLANFVTFGVGGLVSQTGTPLSSVQVGQLLEVLSSACKSYQSGGQADFTTIDVLEALQRAERILPAVPFASFQVNLNGIELSKLKEQFYQQKRAEVK